ncbi:MAG: SpaA isopeptide-forming pilin-related protein [Ignavibacteria bacterium]|nr:SpaA isopeptide-forming pilin-related protein [Ignavibacteria bacterium]
MKPNIQNLFLQITKILLSIFIVIAITFPFEIYGQSSSCNLNNFVTYTQGGWGNKGGKICSGVTFITVKQLETGAEVSKGNGTDKLGSNTTFTFPNGKSVVIHTSCSQPIYIGMTVTSDGFTYKITQLTTIPSSSDNPGTIRDLYFAEVFPNGLEVGGIYKLKLTSASAVENFLPQGGSPKALDKNYINPTSTKAGVFAGQVVALKMNVAFSDAGKIGSGSVKLGELIVNAGPLAGKTVYEVLDIANTALGGGTTPYSISQLNEVVSAINENFDKGKYNKGFLRCPDLPQLGSISGTVFFDLNGNGVLDSSEFGLPNVKVYLYAGSILIDSTFTSEVGFYKFSNLNAGNYSVKVVDPDLLILTNPPNPKSVSLASGENKININFGYKCGQQLAKISGYVFVDANKNGVKDSGEGPLANVTIKLYDKDGVIIGTTTTNSSGYYEFSGLIPGIYTIEEIDPENYRSTTPNFINLSLSSGQNSQNNNFGDILSADICGMVFNDENGDGVKQPSETGIADVLIELFEMPSGEFVASTTTGVNGEYCFTYLIPGTYKIKENDLPGYISTTPNEIIRTVNQGEKSYNNNFGDKVQVIKKGSIGDFVWNDLNKNGIQDVGEPGMPNVIVKLYDCSNNWIKEVTTNSNGFYKFDSLNPGSYQILVQLPNGYAFSPVNQGSDDTKDSDIDPLTWKSHCINLLSGQNLTNVDAGIYQLPTCSIGDRVWNDLNQNGIQDAGEPGVPNIKVKLINCSNSSVVEITTTNSNGNYVFNNVPSGNYQIKFYDIPSGWNFTIKDAGSNDLLDSDADPSTGLTVCFNIDANNCDSNSTRWDAGIYCAPPQQFCSIGDRVWEDVNKNGLQDVNEPGVANVKVILYACSTSTPIDVKFTNSQGYYSFSNVPAGNYYIKFENIPTGYAFTLKDVGSNDQLDSDVDPQTGKTACFPVDPQNCDNNSTKWDAGIYICPPTFEVSGMVFNDANGNGIKDFGEVGIPNVLIKLWGTSANLIATTLTNTQGQFTFTNVLPGQYHVQEIDPPGYISTTPNSFFITVSSSNVTNILFGDKVKPTPEPCDLTKYKTYTQDQWCLEPAKSLLMNKFNQLFPSGFKIGDAGSPHTITFTNATALKNFLPQMGTAGQLTMSYVNPTTTPAGQFAGNVAALALNVAFNDSGLLGSTSTTKLGNLVIASGPMKDYKVYEVLLLANKALGGGTTPFSIQTLNDVVSKINYNFACDCNYGYLTCPPLPDSCGGGFDAGVESNANLADLLLQRLTKIEYGMTTKILRTQKTPFTASIGLQDIFPPVGPMGSRPVETTPFDILGISNATSAYAVDYNLALAKGEVRIASVFATTTNPPYIYEHTKAICDRLINAELDYISQVKIDNHYFFASVLDKADEGIKDYTIHFSIYEVGNKYLVDSRWLIEEYSVPSNATNVYNFQVWGSNFQNAIYLTEMILEQFKSKGQVEYLNKNSVPTSLVYVKKGKYNHNGTIELIVNNEQPISDNITIRFKAREVQGGSRQEFVRTFQINPGVNTLIINTGVLSDANVYINSTNGFKDEIFVSGGAYTYLNGSNSKVNEFVTNIFSTPSLNSLPKESMVLSGGAKISGQLGDWITLFRSLTANTAPYDLSDYYAIRFTIRGYGKVQVRLEQDGIKNFDYHLKRITLDGSEQEITIPFTEFKQLNGNSPLDPRLIRKLSLMITKSDNPTLNNINVEIKNIVFLKKHNETNGNAELPKEFNLAQNYPNPFNPSTLIEYSVAKPERVTIKVYNVLGKEIATLVDEVKEPGVYSVRFDASQLSSGIYFYKLQSESYSAVRKMILQK